MKKLNKKFIAVILAIIIAVSGTVGYFTYNAYALKNMDDIRNKTISFAQFAARHEIPETTIFIGTHLIALEAATDELWERAEESRVVSEQTKIYYKSELAGGIWYDITDAESLMDISNTGVTVSEADLAELRVMYYTFEYGKTMNVNDQRHCIFDGDFNYWDLYHLDELQSTREQYDIIRSRNNNKSEMDKFYRQFLGDFFNFDPAALKSRVCNDADKALYALQDVYDALVAADRKDDADIIYKLMAKLDNLRRSEIYKQLVDEDYAKNMDYLTPWLYKNFRNILDEVLSKCGGEGFAVWAAQYANDKDVDFVVNVAVVNAIGTDIGNCQTAYLEKLSNILEPNGSRVIDQLIYDTSKRIIDGASGGLSSDMDRDIIRLGHLFNIQDQKIINKNDELDLIDYELIGPVTGKFQGAAMAGPSEEYITAKDANASDSALSGMLDTQESQLDFIRLELQDVIRAKVDRMPIEDAMNFVYDRIDMTQGLKDNVPDTDFGANSRTQVQRHIIWLSNLLATLYENSNPEKSELDLLKEKADALLLKQQQALDNNDYRKAKEFDEARKVVLDQIDGKTQELTDTINDRNANAGEKALAQAKLDGGHDGMDKLLQDIVKDALEKQNNGDDISDEVDLLSAMGYTEGLNQLGVDDPADGATVTGEVTGKNISEDSILERLVGLLGDINSLSDSELAGAIRALEIIYDMGYENAGSLAARLANVAVTKGNKYLYGRINDSGNDEYVNCATLAWVASYRYAYDNSKRAGTLIGSGTKPTYQFVTGDTAVYEAINRDTENPVFNEISKMSKVVRLYTDVVYAPVEVANKYFDSLACHIKKSTYGLCITSIMESEAQRLVVQLLPLIDGTN